MDKDDLERHLAILAKQSRNLIPSQPVHYSAPLSPLDFLRCVQANHPIVIDHAADDWPALKNWRSRSYLENIIKDPITVAVTPNGLADAVVDGRFVLPYETKMPIGDLLDKFPPHASHVEESNQKTWTDGGRAPNGPVYYVQSQNNNMHQEFAELLKDVPVGVGFATEALGKTPDAVNFWLGSSRSITSLHKDHYENLYLVVAGTKTFILIPPTESFCLYEKLYPTAIYTPSSPHPDASWTIANVAPPTTTPWCSVDPLKKVDSEQYPLFSKYCRPIVVTLRAGQMLYLPSLWYHFVKQEQELLDGFEAAIAVNFWYDMDYDARFCYAAFVSRLGRGLAGIPAWDSSIEEDSDDEAID